MRFFGRRYPALSNVCFIPCSLVLLTLSGCGAHESAVTGKVTLEGTPLTSGTVAFYPAHSGAAAYGSIQSNGSYTIETGDAGGLAAGEYVVTVVATTPPQAGFPFGKNLTPERYGKLKTSDLKFTVQPGGNTIDLPLSSK